MRRSLHNDPENACPRPPVTDPSAGRWGRRRDPWCRWASSYRSASSCRSA